MFSRVVGFLVEVLAMSKFSQKIELTANILIIVVAVILGFVLVQKYILNPATPNQAARVQPTVGSKMNLQDVNFSSQPKTLILALQTGCHFCNESAPFYRRIVETVKDRNIKLIAAFPTEVEKSTAHLKELGLEKLEVKSSPLNTMQVSGTPTLILLNDKGEITDFWVGKLPADKEAEVITKLIS